MEKISRTQKKKQAEALQRLGEQLVALSEEQTAGLGLPDELAEALSMVRRIKKHEARRRQLQYIGRLMREVDPDAIEEALQKITAQADLDRRRFKLVEQWRDELVAGNDERTRWLTDQFPNMDRRQLIRLVHNARESINTKKARQTNRKLFRFISDSTTT